MDNCLIIVGFGCVNKMVFEFDQGFWPKDTQYFDMVPSSISERGLMVRWLNFWEVVNRPVLLTFAYGQDAYDSEAMTDEQIKTLG